jgi:hypothetical protein
MPPCGSLLTYLVSQGAFANISDTLLQELHVPLKARIRITALAGHFKEKVDHAKHQRGGLRLIGHAGHNAPPQTARKGSGGSAKDADTGTKAKPKPKVMPKVSEKRTHSEDIQHLIDKIRKLVIMWFTVLLDALMITNICAEKRL